MPKSRVIILGVVGLIVLVGILLYFGLIPGLKPNAGKPQTVKLTFWGVYDSPAAISVVAIPGYQITYRQFDPQTYESELINALAAGKGPDIFMVHNTWLPKHADKMAPITSQQLGIGTLRDLFPTVVEQDFGPGSSIVYAAPLYLDTLALLYNKNIFDRKNIALPPKTWLEFQNLIPKLKETDKVGKITQAAAAIGGSNKSISHGTDILNVLMLQAGVQMISPDFSRASFAAGGLEPFNFYAQFANPGSPYYTWSDALPYSLDNFAQEKTAMIFAYAYQIPALKQKNPFLEIGIAPLPQPSQSERLVNYANYWGVAVSNKFANPTSAWNFIWQLTINQTNAKAYADAAGHLPALRTLVTAKNTDPFWDVFAGQTLTARSWPKIDNTAVDNAFSKMIEQVINGQAVPQAALQEAESAVTQLMQNKNKSL